MIGLALAAPAFAAPADWRSAAPDAAVREVPLGIAAETAGVAPQAEAMPDGRPAFSAEAVPMRPAPPAARPLIALGTPRDRVRAQHCLAMAIYYEAASEPDAGQRAVAQVVLNRVAHPAWPNSICGVVFQGSGRTTGCQFTFTCDESLARQPSRLWWDRAARVARAALTGAVYEPVGLATHYHTADVAPYWADSLQPMGRIGAHLFYRWAGASGRPAAFTANYAGMEPVAAPHSRPSATPTASIARYTAHAIMPSSHAAAQDTASAAHEPPPAAMLPTGGSVRPEYAHSGQWTAHP